MKKILLLIICMVGTTSIYAQRTDIELWSGGELNLKMQKRFTLYLDQVFKFKDTISHFKSAYTQFGGDFKINHFFSVGADYRYIENPPSKNAHRLSGDLVFNVGKKKFPLSLLCRLRYQHEIKASNKNTEDLIRSKLTLNYNLCKLVDPYISFEPFFRLNGKNEFRVIRYAIGLKWRLIEDLHLASFYLFQKEVNVKKAGRTHVVGLMLSYDFKTYQKAQKNKPAPRI